MSAVETQLVEMLRMTEEHIAIAYRLPLQVLGISKTAPYASTEMMMSDWNSKGLGFALGHIEDAIGHFFGLKGYPEEYIEFDTAVLLRSAQKDRLDALAKGVQGGIYAPNEARRLEGLAGSRGRRRTPGPATASAIVVCHCAAGTGRRLPQHRLQMTMLVGMGEKTKRPPKRQPSAQSSWRAPTGTRGSVVSSTDWARVLGELAADEAVKTRRALDGFALTVNALETKLADFASAAASCGTAGRTRHRRDGRGRGDARRPRRGRRTRTTRRARQRRRHPARTG
jgi:hypothetical protein